MSERIILPVCNACHKPLFGREKAEDRCWCNTIGNWVHKEMDKEEEKTS